MVSLGKSTVGKILKLKSENDAQRTTELRF